MCRGGAFDSLFCPAGRVFVHNDCPVGGGGGGGEGRVFAPFKSWPGGWLWMKLIPALIINVSVNSKPDHPPPGDPQGFAHSSCPWGRVLLLCLARGSALGRVLNKSKSSIILKKSAIFALPLKQMSSSSFRKFMYVIVEVSSATYAPFTL